MSVIERLIKDQWLRNRDYDEKRRKGIVLATDLTMCPLKRRFLIRYPIIYSPSPAMIVGSLVHLGLEAHLAGTTGGTAEVTMSRRIDGTTIEGTIDVLTGDTVYEIKSGRDHKGPEPSEHHVLQTRIYMWLSGRRRGRIVYATMNRLCEYDVEDPCTDDEIRLLLKSDAAPRWEWECRGYCPFSVICPKRST